MFYTIPGHWIAAEHLEVSVGEPEHGAPLCCAGGLSHTRERVCVPPEPHVTLHKLYASQEPQPPATSSNDKE